MKYYIQILSLCLISIFASLSPMVGQANLLNDLEVISEFNEMSKKVKGTLDAISYNFISYTENDKALADSLLHEVLDMEKSLRKDRNEFLHMTFLKFDDDQKQIVANRIAHEIDFSDPLYFDLVSKYQLRNHYSRMLEEFDPEFETALIKDFNDYEKFSDEHKYQMSCLAAISNLEDSKVHENKILNLISALDENMKNENDLRKINRKMAVLYNQIIPNSLGKLTSKSSVINSLYLMDNEMVISGGHDVSDTNLAWKYVITCIAPKFNYLDEKYWDESKFIFNKDEIKKEVLSTNTTWLEHIKN